MLFTAGTGKDRGLEEAGAMNLCLVTAEGQLLTLSAREALAAGVADAVLPSADAATPWTTTRRRSSACCAC